MPGAVLQVRDVERLEDADVLGAGTFGSFAFGERDSVAFTELLEAGALEVRVVEEHVLPSSHLDESEALVCETLDRTF